MRGRADVEVVPAEEMDRDLEVRPLASVRGRPPDLVLDHRQDVVSRPRDPACWRRRSGSPGAGPWSAGYVPLRQRDLGGGEILFLTSSSRDPRFDSGGSAQSISRSAEQLVADPAVGPTGDRSSVRGAWPPSIGVPGAAESVPGAPPASSRPLEVDVADEGSTSIRVGPDQVDLSSETGPRRATS